MSAIMSIAASSAPQQSSVRNRLLAALPAGDLARLEPHLARVPLPRGWVVYESDAAQAYLYFPTTAIVSLTYRLEGRASAEIGMVGNDGVVGIALFTGGETTTRRAVVRSAGEGYRLSAAVLKEEFDRRGALWDLLLRHTQALMTQMAQNAVCNRHHSLEQQLCRWLLMNLDRLASSELAVTHELMAGLLGMRREGVTEAAGRLQAAGIIHYSRGRITVLDRTHLEARACECYEVVRRETERLFPQ